MSSQAAKLKKLLKTTIRNMAQNSVEFVQSPGKQRYGTWHGTKPNLRGHREEILLESENWTLPLWYLYCSA